MRPELEKVCRETEKVIAGKRAATEKILLAILAGGHILLDDVPGVGKTTLAVTLCRSMGLNCRRIQFTPDVLPSDITGFSVYQRESGGFQYQPGVLNGTNLLLGDEINRASSKTQSALLEAMEERQVTVDGVTYPMETPFTVIATENSVGTAGTQPLPYAQMDRFLIRISLGYPDHEAQMRMLKERQGENPLETVEEVIRKEELLKMQEETRNVTARDAILDYIIRLSEASRTHPAVEIGISPRGSLFLDRAAKARAWTEGRDYVTGPDVAAVFRDVCAHRLILKKESGETAERVLDELLKTVETPDHHGMKGLLKQ
jgi:MoxR-like ATPase